MNAVMDAHPATVIIVIAALMVTPAWFVMTYAMSGASLRKGITLATAFLLWGAAMTWFTLAGVSERVEPPLGQLVIPVCWLMPSILLLLTRKHWLSDPLDQRWLVGLQLWRAIGGVFLIEMSRGNLPGSFAWPAGVGDLIAAAVAAWVLIVYRARPIPAGAIILVAVVGIADFASAFFFGFTSSAGPQQLFAFDNPNRVQEFPTGLIPLFLVPYAIFFHTLSLACLFRFGVFETTRNQTDVFYSRSRSGDHATCPSA
ncbi:MAG: hypothetical protein AAGH92_02985 [Planctomycetota bacterium]